MKKIVAILLVLLLGITGCGSFSDKFDNSIVIGVAGTMWIMEDASKYLAGIRLAVEEINAQGGIQKRKVKLLELDDQALTMEGIKIAQALADNPKITAVIGHWDSHVTLPVASIYENAGVLMITAMATSPKLTQNGYKYIFRNVPNDEIMGANLAAFARDKGLKRMAIYYADTDYGRGLANSFERVARTMDVKIVDRTTHFVNQEDFVRTMERWKAFNCDGVFIADYMPEAGNVIKKVRQAYPGIPIMGSDGLDSPDFIEVMQEEAEGVEMGTLYNPNEARPELLQFINNFRQHYNAEPDMYAVQGYETVKLLATAMQEVRKLEAKQIADALRKIKDWPGLTGTLTVENSGDVTGKVIHRKIVQDGTFIYLTSP